jgi:phosphoglycerol transferase MdoB-like AlkP superfamily enzyme
VGIEMTSTSNARERSPRLAALAVIAVFTLELFVVQAVTLLPPHGQASLTPWLERGVRLLLDGLFVSALVFALPRAALIAVFALAQPFFLGLLIYRGYYAQPLSWLVMTSQGGEGVDVADAAFSLIQLRHAVLLLVLGLLGWLVWRDPYRWPARRRRWGLRLGLGYVALVLVCNLTFKPMWKVATWESMGSLGAVYGYAPAWFAEAVYVDEALLVKRAIERGEQASDRMRGLAASFPVRERLVFLQVESLDFPMIDFEVHGQPVTPFLNELRHRARLYAVRAAKGTGSADADFIALMGRRPSSDVVTYKLASYPFERSIIAKLRANGYHTSAVHGVSGEFFNRRFAYTKMGFDHLAFREEIARAKPGVYAWAIPDAVVLEHGAQLLNAGSGKQFQLAITATSHIPFRGLEDRWKRFFPKSNKSEETFFDAIRYADGAIRTFVEKLPPETTLIVYGDHNSQVENDALGFRQMIRDGQGCVPFLIHDTSVDLAPTQRIDREGTAIAGTFSLLDAMRFVHANVFGSGGRVAAQQPLGIDVQEAAQEQRVEPEPDQQLQPEADAALGQRGGDAGQRPQPESEQEHPQ